MSAEATAVEGEAAALLLVEGVPAGELWSGTLLCNTCWESSSGPLRCFLAAPEPGVEACSCFTAFCLLVAAACGCSDGELDAAAVGAAAAAAAATTEGDGEAGITGSGLGIVAGSLVAAAEVGFKGMAILLEAETACW